MQVSEYVTKINEKGLTYLEEKDCYVCESTLEHPGKVQQLINSIYEAEFLAEEHVYAIAVNAVSKPLGIFEVTHGCVDKTPMNPREILIRMLLCGATAFILAHNHPSGSVSPSDADLKSTELMTRAGYLIGLKLLDHIILSRNGYFSFMENGLIKDLTDFQ